MAKALYITQDGITDHIGQAQIAPYLIGLARLGHRIHIVSAEKPGRERLRRRYEQMFDEVGIKWTTVPYRNSPPLVSSAWTLMLMWRAAARVVQAERPQMVHCRSYLPLGLAARLKDRYGTKYLADFRDFWADVGIETKRFKWIYRLFRKRESIVLRNADHLVTLTERAATVLIERHPHVVGGNRSRFTVIPCCADFDLFDPARVQASDIARRRRELDIPEGAPVLVYLGSLGPDYLLRPMMELFRELRALHDDAVFLLLVNNGHELAKAEASEVGVPEEALRFASAARDDIPEYLSLATLSPVFIRPTLSKAGCSPTKLGELFAMNVPVVANSGYGDIDRIVDMDRNGSTIVDDFTPACLRAALEQVLPNHGRGFIRGNSSEFSLREGVKRYDGIYRLLTDDMAVRQRFPEQIC
jgi:glycosyltransferase involved in cell wall biosynthesis